ncbi:MAG: nitrophenyl compound nitroreductase subunit ArsF family protein [Verrucomicrobiae bacterium]|nr:nitrophenyl compound nitroreductase subunit ArsF family protein [Verrucomicrobiae bacterium]
MTGKKLLTWALSLFVVISISVLVYKETTVSRTGHSGPVVAIPPVGTKLVAYYFHGARRCPTCLSIEQNSREAVERYFADDLRNGRIEFARVNMDEPQHKHFVKDYQLAASSVVLALYQDGRQQRWKNLEQVWDFAGDKEKFHAYVKEEIKKLREGSN